MSLTVRSLGSIGAEISGIDISRTLAPHEVEALIRAWHEHLVLVIRGQRLDDFQLAAFSRNFGDLEQAPVPEVLKGSAHAPALPEVTVISNVIENGVPIGGLGDGEAAWHTDMSYIEAPPPGCVLYALELPSSGGDTWFTNMYQAYERLPAPLKRRIEGLRINHDASTTSAGTLRRGFEAFSNPSQAPGTHHPAVLVHSRTGRRALYLGRRLNAWVVGLPVPESEALLDELWAHATAPESTYVHVWRLGDVVMWDNRCVMHRRDGWSPLERRILHRTQLRGSSVF